MPPTPTALGHSSSFWFYFLSFTFLLPTADSERRIQRLSETFYDTTCPNLTSIVSDLVTAAVNAEARMAASLLRLHFHDCWPNGCDASLLLDATPTFQSEKNAPQNNNSLRGFEVIDQIKAAVEQACPKTVSCADILTLASLDAVVAAGGAGWAVALGRRDSTTSAFAAAAAFLPTPDLDLPALIQNFARVGFSTQEMITLSGAHTIGRARCASIEARLYPTPEADINKSFLKKLQKNCPKNGNVSVLNNFDQATPDLFDNAYYQNLQQGKGLLHSDQALFSTKGSNVATVNLLASASGNFLGDFAGAMIKMDDISPLTGKQGQIRQACWVALLLLSAAATVVECQTFPPGLDENFYNVTCPNLKTTVRNQVIAAVQQEARMAASLLRLHFHDCWPNGCDASVLLDASSAFGTEKTVPANNNSLRGFEVIDQIKAQVEQECPNTVSCADILTLAALFAVIEAKGPGWPVALGRRDSTTTAVKAANATLPKPEMSFYELVQNFKRVNFTIDEMITLSGAHTIGRARCATITSRLYPVPDADINSTYLQTLEANCPLNGNASVLNDFDSVTPDLFDNQYYKNLQQKKGLLHSDQELLNGVGANAATVNLFANASGTFFADFAAAMIKMDNLSPLTGKYGEIRLNCHTVNSPAIREMDSTDIDPLLALQ
ncbi:unnamed protein product [Sphagnum compactum]